MHPIGNLAHSTPEEDHHHVIAAAHRPAAEWRPVGQSMMTFSPWTSGTAWIGGRQESYVFSASLQCFCRQLELDNQKLTDWTSFFNMLEW